MDFTQTLMNLRHGALTAAGWLYHFTSQSYLPPFNSDCAAIPVDWLYSERYDGHYDELVAIWSKTLAKANKLYTEYLMTSKDTYMNPQIVRLANTTGAIDAIRQDLIRCGFELEFHSLNGATRDGEIDYDADPDWDILHADAEVQWLEASWDEIKQYYNSDDFLYPFIEHIMQKYPCVEVIKRDTSGAIRSIIMQYLESGLNSYVDDVTPNLLENDPGRYYPKLESDFNLHTSETTEQYIELGDDSSVRGGELRTLGALTPLTFLSVADDVLSCNTFEVAENCSFHIHLSVPDVKHSYSAAMQAELTGYLLNNINRMPDRVQRRLKSHACVQYARLRLSTDKYTAVHYHKRLGTWEFRLFGNIDSYEDAQQCLILAIEAMRHAYRVKLELTPSIVRLRNIEAIGNVADEMIKNNRSYSHAVKLLNTRIYKQETA